MKQAQSAAGVGTDLWTCKRLQDSAVDVTGKVPVPTHVPILLL